MKNNLTRILCLVLLTLSAATVNAQQNRSSTKPVLFSNLPAVINFTEAQLSSLFNSAKGQNISLPVASQVSLTGPVTSNLVKYANLQTLVIQLPAYNNTFFSISKQTENNTINYVGRIFNPAYADGYELKKTASGSYQLIKLNTENILTNCSQ